MTTRLERAKRNVGSTYWRNKADKEITRLTVRRPCAVCQSQGLDNDRGTCGHHLISKGRSTRHRHTLQNLVVLCHSHHKASNDLAPHSTNALAVKRFLEWLEDNRPQQFKWICEHEHDTWKPDYKARYEALKEIER